MAKIMQELSLLPSVAIMTTDRLSQVLADLGWSSQELARRLNIAERSVRRWLSGQQEVPPGIETWLEAMAALMRSGPPPPGRNSP